MLIGDLEVGVNCVFYDELLDRLVFGGKPQNLQGPGWVNPQPFGKQKLFTSFKEKELLLYSLDIGTLVQEGQQIWLFVERPYLQYKLRKADPVVWGCGPKEYCGVSN